MCKLTEFTERENDIQANPAPKYTTILSDTILLVHFIQPRLSLQKITQKNDRTKNLFNE